MADKELVVPLNSTYRLEWRVPATAVTNAFVDADGTSHEFPHPDPPPEGTTPDRIEIRVTKGSTPHWFRKNRTPPSVIERVVTVAGGKKRRVKVFSATFEAREEDVFLFTITTAKGQSETQKMTVKAKKVYRTIEDVIKDSNERRLAVLASVAEFFPAFNTHGNPNVGTKGEKLGEDSGFVRQGPWVGRYPFDPNQGQTSCVTVNPHIMREKGVAESNTKRWAFHSGPAHPLGPNPAWVFSEKDRLPNVGDTYIVLNPWKDKDYGHVGIVLHVPPKGTGLWVTADGGQGTNPRQLALLIPRWGLMGKDLPLHGGPGNTYPEMEPEPDAGPFLSGATPEDIDQNAPVPAQNGDVPGIIGRLRFRPSPAEGKTSNPRRLEGFVDVDDARLTFEVDGKSDIADLEAKCRLLEGKVKNVIEATLANEVVLGKGT